MKDEPFRTLFEPHRRAVTLHCYRMLGSLQDAEEIAQEALLRAWQRAGQAQRVGAERSWLFQIATNACLDHLLKARRRRALPHLVAPPQRPGEQLWLEPVPEALLELGDASLQPEEQAARRESVGLAFIAALQLLSPKQRAAVLLVDVLGWSASDTAAALETTAFSINSLLQRARKNLAARREHSPSQLPSDEVALLRRFIAAWERGDLDALAALLARDAILSMPPQPEWFKGRAAIRRFFARVWSAQPGQRRLVPLRANGGPAVAVYRRPTAPDAVFEPSGITLVAFRGQQVSQLTRFAFPELFPLFGLAQEPPKRR